MGEEIVLNVTQLPFDTYVFFRIYFKYTYDKYAIFSLPPLFLKLSIFFQKFSFCYWKTEILSLYNLIKPAKRLTNFFFKFKFDMLKLAKPVKGYKNGIFADYFATPMFM